MSLQKGMDSLAKMLNATEHRLGSDYFILSDPHSENGCRIYGNSYYTKIMANQESQENHRDRFLIPALASHGRCPCRFSLAFVVA